MPFEFKPTKLEGVIEVQPRIFPDERGYFVELFKQSDFLGNGVMKTIAQINFSHSKKGVIRALHYQLPPKAQAKLVQVTRGAAFDVAVDIRKDSSTYGEWVGVHLNSEKKNMLFIPEGFAHGFCALEEDTELLYYCSNEYSPEHERGIVWNDPTLNIQWPIETTIVGARDAAFPTFGEAEKSN